MDVGPKTLIRSLILQLRRPFNRLPTDLDLEELAAREPRTNLIAFDISAFIDVPLVLPC